MKKGVNPEGNMILQDRHRVPYRRPADRTKDNLPG